MSDPRFLSQAAADERVADLHRAAQRARTRRHAPSDGTDDTRARWPRRLAFVAASVALAVGSVVAASSGLA